MMVASSGEHHD